MVPAAKYEDAQANFRIEQTAHRQTSRELNRARHQLRRAQAAIDERAHQLAETEQLLAQARLEVGVVAQARQQAAQLVDQLRVELGRVGDHLRSFSEENQELGEALASTQARVERLATLERSVAFRFSVVRDLALALSEPLATGDYELSVVAGRVVLRVPAQRVFAADGNEIRPDALGLLAAVGRVGRRHSTSRVSITERGGQSDPDQVELALRLEQVSERLVAQGFAEDRVLIVLPEAGAASGGAAENADSTLPDRPVVSAPAEVHFAIFAEPA
jgi:flagellar motor protein MotB